MTVGTIRLHEKNAELFNSLSKEIRSLQSQVGSGKADLKLSHNLHEISKLSAAQEAKSELGQYRESAKRAFLDLETVDLTLDRMQNLIMKLNEMSVQSTNDILRANEREAFVIEVKSIKEELFALANQEDSFGNSIFGGVSGKKKPFMMDNYGNVSYVGSGTPKSVKVGGDAYVNQNFAEYDIQNIIFGNEKFSIFELADDYIESLKVDLSSSRSENLFSDGTSWMSRASTGDEATVSFVLDTGAPHAISAKVYGNDYSVIATEQTTIYRIICINCRRKSDKVTRRLRRALHGKICGFQCFAGGLKLKS